jgi:hypothetical protein
MKLVNHLFLWVFWAPVAFAHAPCPEHLKQFLTRYERPFTLVEVSPGASAVSFAIAKEFDCTCVIIEHDAYQQLLGECKQENSEHVILLARTIGWPGYRTLSECEHFDVVVISDIQKRFAVDMEPNWGCLLQLGDYTFIEIPKEHVDYVQNVRSYLQAQGISFQELENDTGNVCIFIDRPRKTLKRKVWQSDINALHPYSIQSTFKTKELVNRFKGKATPWIPGINLATFITLNGMYPDKDWISKKITEFKGVKHNDFWFGNMIIQGAEIKLIDFGDKRRNANFEKQYKKTLAIIKSLRSIPW